MEFILGVLMGYLFGVFIGGEKEGDIGRIHWEWFIQKTRIHLHHWMVFSMLLLIYATMCDNMNMFIQGVLAGGIIHGLTYDDWYKIIK